MLKGSFGTYSETYSVGFSSGKTMNNLTAEDLTELALEGEEAISLGYVPGAEVEYDYYATKGCKGIIKEINTTPVSWYSSKNLRVLRIQRTEPKPHYNANQIDIVALCDIKQIITPEKKLPLIVSHASARVVENEHSLQLVSEAQAEAESRNIKPGVRVKFLSLRNGVPQLNNGIVVDVLKDFKEIIFIHNLHPAIVKIKYMTTDWQDNGVDGVFAYKPVNGTYSPNAVLINGVVKDHD